MGPVFMILITGGAGFIGSHLVDAFLSSGESVRVLDNLATGRLSNLANAFRYGKSFEFIEGDINDSLCLDAALSGVHAVIHLAAQVSVQNSLLLPVSSASTNIIGYIRLIEKCREIGVRKFIYASSAAVYGFSGVSELNEDSDVAPISPYGLEKLINERYASLYSSLYGLECIGLRFFNVYGPRQDPKSSYAGVISKFLYNANGGLPLVINGDGSQSRDFVSVFDIVKVCQQAILASYSGVVCVGTGRSVSINCLARTVLSLVESDSPVIYSAPIVGDITSSVMSPFRCLSLFGFKPEIGLEEGLSRMIYNND